MSSQFLLNASVQQINAEIDTLQAKINELEAQRNTVYDAEKTCIAALQAIENAVALLNEVDPSQIAIFGEFIAAKFAEFAQPKAPAPETQSEPETPAPEIEPAPAPETQSEPEAPAPEIEPAPAPETQSEPEAPAPEKVQMATLAELKALSIQAIRKLAARKKIGGSGTRMEIAGRLAGLVTTAEWRALM